MSQLTSHQLIPMNDMERMSVAIAKSGLFGMKTPDQALALMLLAQAEGMHPAIAARDFHIVQGRPALKSDAMLARFQAAGGKVAWNTYTDSEVSGTFTHPSGGSVTIVWTLSQAKAAGLAQKDVWKQYPRAMLRARVISEGIRTVYPGVSVGIYSEEEVRDFDGKPEAKEVQAEVQPIKTEQVKVQAPKEPTLADAIQASGWTTQQLREYCQLAFSAKSSKELSDEQRKLLQKVVEHPFETAYAEAIKLKNATFEAQDEML